MLWAEGRVSMKLAFGGREGGDVPADESEGEDQAGRPAGAEPGA